MHDELINALRRLSDWSIMDFEDNLSYANQIAEEAADAIQELRRCEAVALAYCADEHNRRLTLEQRYRWIPVTERLPEIDMSYPHHEDYLVQYDSGNMDVASWSNVNRFWTDHVTEPHWNCVQFAEVIAWMPLPEPPEKESEP